MPRRNRRAKSQYVAARPPFPEEKASQLRARPGRWAVDRLAPVAAMRANTLQISETDAVVMTRLAVYQAYEQTRQAAQDARSWASQCDALLTLVDRDDLPALQKALRDLDPRCLAPDQQQNAYELLKRVHAEPAPCPSELRKAIRTFGVASRGRRPDPFVDAFVRALARWWRAVTGETPPLTRNPATKTAEEVQDAPPHFLDLLNAARQDAGKNAGLGTLTSAARRVGEAIRSEDKERSSGWTVGDATWSPRFEDRQL